MSKNNPSSVISLPSANLSSPFGHIKPTNLLNDIFSTNYLGGNHTVKCIFHDDKNSSLSVNFDTGDFKCHACHEYGTDMTDIYIKYLGLSFSQARNELKRQGIVLAYRESDMPLKQLASGKAIKEKTLHGKKKNPPPRVNPSPELTAETFPLPSEEEIKRLFPKQFDEGYEFKSLQIYHDLNSNPIYCRPRLELPTGRKYMRPVMFDGKKFRVKEPDFNGLKPLYNLHILNQSPFDQIVYLVEGEKCADLFIERKKLGMTSGGSTSAKSADWSKLADRTIIVIPDNDRAGKEYARYVIEAVTPYAKEVRWLDISQLALAEGQDIADWFERSKDNTVEKLNRMETVNTDIPASLKHHEKSENDKHTHLFGKFYYFNESIYVPVKSADKFDEVCKFIEITAFTRCTGLVEYGAVATFKGESETLITLYFEFKDVHIGTTLIERLSALGLYINPSRSSEFKCYLAKACELQTQCLRRALRPGWFGDGHEHFVLPDQVIGSANDIIFQPMEPSLLSETIKSSGSLKEWKQVIGSKLVGNHYLVSMLGLAMSSLLLRAAAIENRGFNLCGSSGSGKTTAIQVAATLFGDGTQPGQGVNHIYTHQWNSTANSMEMLTSQHNDLPMIVDELGMLDDKDFGKTIYRMCSGSIKGRLDQSAKQKESRTWRNLILMSAEIPIADKVSESGKPPKAGQLVRFIDIAVTREQMVNKRPDSPDDKSFIEALKIACGKYYGTAGPEFIRRFANDDTVNVPALRQEAEEELVKDNPGISPEHQRVFRHFSLVVVALKLAHKYGVLNNDLSESMFVVAKNYVATSGSLNDAHRGADCLRSELRSNMSQFDDLDRDQAAPAGCERRGFIIGKAPPKSLDDDDELTSLAECKAGTVIRGDWIETRWFVMDKPAIEKMLGSYPFQETMEHLKALGLLNINDQRSGGLMGKRRRCGGLPQARYYEISFRVFRN